MRYLHYWILIWSVCQLANASTIQFGIDNDIVFQMDGDYTNGLFLGYASESRPLASESLIPLPINQHYQANWTVSVAQRMWTPSDISQTKPQDNERPYAGLLSLNAGLVASDGDNAHRLGAMVGVVGPGSGAEKGQKRIHSVFDSTQPEGWHYQVKNTMVAELTYEQDYGLYRSQTKSYQHELSGYGRLAVGNFQPEIATGLGWRWGKNLQNSFNASALRPYRQQVMVADGLHSRWYVYGNLEARYRFYDITLSGETLKPVPEVERQAGQMTLATGVVYFHKRLGVGMSSVTSTKAFREDKRRWHSRGAVTLYWILQ